MSLPTHARCRNCQHWTAPLPGRRPHSVTPVVHGLCTVVEERPARAHQESVCTRWLPELFSCPACDFTTDNARVLVGHLGTHAVTPRQRVQLQTQRARAPLGSSVARVLRLVLCTLVTGPALRGWE